MPSSTSGKLRGNPYNTNLTSLLTRIRPIEWKYLKIPLSQFMNIHKSCEDIIQRCEKEDDNRR
jgi:hypothetical protein